MRAKKKDAPQVTNQKKCPRCGDENVQYQGAGVGVGVGPGKLNIQKHLFKCSSCGEDFWYTGKFP